MTLRYHIKSECAYSTSMCYVHTNIDIRYKDIYIHIYIYSVYHIHIYGFENGYISNAQTNAEYCQPDIVFQFALQWT